jgi:hypothetical protein
MKEDKVENKAARAEAREIRRFWRGVNVEKGGSSSCAVGGGGLLGGGGAAAPCWGHDGVAGVIRREGGAAGGCWSCFCFSEVVLRSGVEEIAEEEVVGREARTDVPRAVADPMFINLVYVKPFVSMRMGQPAI